MKRSDISDMMVCQAYAAAKEQGVFADAILMGLLPDCPEKVIYSAMERAFNHGLIEFGVTLRSGWLTDKGREVLAGRKREEAA